MDPCLQKQKEYFLGIFSSLCAEYLGGAAAIGSADRLAAGGAITAEIGDTIALIPLSHNLPISHLQTRHSLQPSIVNNKVYFITIGPMMPPDWVDVISTYLARMHICVIIAETNAVDINQIKENLRTRTHVFFAHFLHSKRNFLNKQIYYFTVRIFSCVCGPKNCTRGGPKVNFDTRY